MRRLVGSAGAVFTAVGARGGGVEVLGLGKGVERR